MSKIRVYEAAKTFHVSSEALLDIIRGLGVEVKSHMSSIDDAVMERLKDKFHKEVEVAKEELARKREKEVARAREVTAPPAPAPQRPQSPPPARTFSPGPARPSAPPTGSAPRPQPGSSPPQHGQHSRPQSSFPQRGPRPRGAKKKRRGVDEKLVADNVKRTLASMDAGSRHRSRRTREREDGTVVEEDVRTLKATEFLTVSEIAGLMEVKPQEVIAACMRLGVMANINKRLDKDTIGAVADEFGFAVEFVEEYGAETLQEVEPEVGDLSVRAPVVTIMGHVDHGKTSLLDFIRRTNVAGGETGGITQHIGAYSVKAKGKTIAFLDTPGHEAFTSMRARGAQVTDIVVLVVAADDRVMPQTIEAIDHARAANVPIIVAINKVDLPGARPDLVRADLTKHHLVAEEYGGEVIMVEVSAKKGTGVDQLLEMILLKAELMDLKAVVDRRAKGTVIEARVEPGRGTVVTVLVQSGTLHVSDAFVAGRHFGKVRALSNELGERVKEAGPSTPVEVTGFSGAPTAGDTFQVVEAERDARDIAGKRQQLQREQEFRSFRRMSLAELSARVQQGEVGELRLIIKADVDGSAEALADHLSKLGTDEVKLRIIHSGVGNITESDVLLAAASDAVIIAFRVKVETKARDAAAREKVDVRSYEIIYKAEEDVKAAMSGLLKPEIKETITGSAEIRNVFNLSRSGVVAGCFVSNGTITRGSKARLLRGSDVVFEGRIGTLKRFKDDVREVNSGFECGITLDGYTDYRQADVIQAYTLEEVARSLA